MTDVDTLLQGRYLVKAAIARGGMGAVYLAEDQRLRSKVALKEALVTDPDLARQFQREAVLLANLRHPALALVTDHFSEGGRQFLVMEYISGPDLASFTEAGSTAPVPPVALEWIEQLLDALDYLHSRSAPIVHRDVKPQNIKLTGDGRIMLLDFGLAKGSVSGRTAAHSQGGYTPAYAPPEQILQSGTDARSDLYSVGATLFELLTSQLPPDALTRRTAVAQGHADPLPEVDRIGLHVSCELAAYIRRAMALNREDRFANAKEMRLALRTLPELARRSAQALGEQMRGHGPAVRVFISTITPHTDVQRAFLDTLFERLRAMRIEPVQVATTVFDKKDPFGKICRTIESCRAVLAIGLERTHVYFLRDKEGTDAEHEAIHRKYTSGWLHLEAGMAHALGKEIFVLCQHDICSDGIFDRWWNTYPVTEVRALRVDSTEVQGFLRHLQEWADSLSAAERTKTA